MDPCFSCRGQRTSNEMQRYQLGSVSKKLEAVGPSYFKALSQPRILQVEENLKNFGLVCKPIEILSR
jgi:hypothetical protein